jgi:hypothetical protein
VHVGTHKCHYISTFNSGIVTISVQFGTQMGLTNFLVHTGRNFKQTNGLSLNGCNVVMHIATAVLIAYERSDYALVTQHPRAARYFPGITQNQTSTQGKCKYYNAFGNISGALCKFTGTLTLICRVVARLCTIIHVLLHQPSSSSYSLSSSFSFSPFIPYAFCVVSIDTTQCGAVSKVPTNIWQGRVKSTTKCDKRNRERESSKCGTGKQIQEITTRNKVSCIKIPKLLYTKERVINSFLRDRVRIMYVLVWCWLCITITVQAGSK